MTPGGGSKPGTLSKGTPDGRLMAIKRVLGFPEIERVLEAFSLLFTARIKVLGRGEGVFREIPCHLGRSVNY